MRRPGPKLLSLCLLCGAAIAQNTERVIDVTVTSASGRSVYLDRGRSDGLVTGTVVKLYPPGTAMVEVTVRSASRSWSRADLDLGIDLPPVGTRGEARVVPPAAAVDSQQAERPVETPVEHPPWQRELERRDDDQPLLVPTFGQRPDERPMLLHGRLYSSLDWTRDRGDDRGNDYTLGRIGTRIEATNPFSRGGRLLVDAEFNHRRFDSETAATEEDNEGRIEELSYAWGEEDGQPIRYEIGRFHSRAVPEVGLLDGVEGAVTLTPRWRVGAGIGGYPVPFPAEETGEDLGLHLFATYEGERPGDLTARMAFQHTWHRGHPDRDLFIAAAQGRVHERIWLYGMAKVDLYSDSDTRKDTSIQLTEFTGQARYDGSSHGFGATATHFRWPDLERQDYRNLPDELVRDGLVNRLSMDGWWRANETTRVSGRFGLWADQDSNGSSWELASDLDRLFGSAASLHTALFRADGSYNAGPGFRARLRSPINERIYGTLGYGWHRYDVESLLAGTETYTRQYVQMGVQWALDSVDIELDTEVRFGDREDVWALGLFAQYRF